MRNLLSACLVFLSISCLFCGCGKTKEQTPEQKKAMESEDPGKDLNLKDEK